MGQQSSRGQAIDHCSSKYSHYRAIVLSSIISNGCLIMADQEGLDLIIVHRDLNALRVFPIFFQRASFFSCKSYERSFNKRYCHCSIETLRLLILDHDFSTETIQPPEDQWWSEHPQLAIHCKLQNRNTDQTQPCSADRPMSSIALRYPMTYISPWRHMVYGEANKHNQHSM